MEETRILKTEAEFYELIEVDGDYQGPVYLNTAHIVAIKDVHPEMEVCMSDGKTYRISDNDSVRLRTYLHASKAL